jgi:hypothetical protein
MVGSEQQCAGGDGFRAGVLHKTAPGLPGRNLISRAVPIDFRDEGPRTTWNNTLIGTWSAICR